MARISYAENAQEALADFGQEFGPFFANGAQVLVGVHENGVTQALFTPEALRRVRQLEGRATLELSARFHLNLA